MLRIYGSARSRGTRTLCLAGELGLKYEHLDYRPRSPATKHAGISGAEPQRPRADDRR